MIESDQAEIAARGQETDLIIAKHRNGEVGSVPLMFFPSYTCFENKSRIEEEDIPMDAI